MTLTGATLRPPQAAFKFLSFGTTHVGCVRASNEDAFLNNAREGVWGVADGMGGHSGGDVASARVITALSHLRFENRPEAAQAYAMAALQSAHADLLARGRSEFGGPIGTTVAALLACGRKYICLWAGDSRVYRLRAGQLQQLTHDHRYVQDLIDAGVLSAEQAQTHPRAHVITRAVGATPAMKLEVVEGGLRPGDRFLLCSDGLSNVVAAGDLANALRRNPLETAVDRMMQNALARGAPDNVTAVLVAVE